MKNERPSLEEGDGGPKENTTRRQEKCNRLLGRGPQLLELETREKAKSGYGNSEKRATATDPKKIWWEARLGESKESCHVQKLKKSQEQWPE